MADPNTTNYLYTLGGYATLIGIGYALYHVSSQKAGRRSVANGTRGPKMPHQEPRKEDRKKKQRMESFVSETQGGSRASTRHKSAADIGSSLSSSAAADTADDDVDNKEFAKQLAKAKEGTKLAATAETSKLREKSVKQSRANQMFDDVSEDKLSTASSTTGVDGDVDEQSVPISPETAPADASSGVADMLEPTPAGPSVLRITGAEAEKAKAKAAPRAREQAESKKQRQNRKKAEAAKAVREEAEEKRKVLEESQRRQARIAEGRAAKDGSQFMAATAANSVWTQGATNGHRAQAAHASALQQPLDTFERPNRESASKQAAAAAVSSDSSWISSLPSEEEQMEMLKVEADEWSTVQTKAAKKAAKKASSVSSMEDKAPAQPPTQSQAKQQPSAGKTKASKTLAAAHPFGSFSALTTKENGADDGQEEEEDEEEWDV